MKKIIFITGLYFVFGKTFSQNLPHYSLYMLNQQLINSAVIGSYDEITGGILYRTQWIGFDGAPKTKSFDVNVPIPGKKSVLGLDFIDDKIGVNSFQRVSLNYAYKLKLDKKQFLSFGFSFSLRMFKSNLSQVETQQINDPQFSVDTKTLLSPNFKFGLYYFKKDFYAGLSIPNLMYNQVFADNNNDFKASMDFSPSKMHIYLHSGTQKSVSKDIKIQPSVLVKFVSGSPVQFDLNGRFLYKNMIGIGLSYRTINTIVFIASYKVNQYITLGYAYNHNFSVLSQFGSNSHEIMLVYSIASGKGRFKIDIPRF